MVAGNTIATATTAAVDDSGPIISSTGAYRQARVFAFPPSVPIPGVDLGTGDGPTPWCYEHFIHLAFVDVVLFLLWYRNHYICIALDLKQRTVTVFDSINGREAEWRTGAMHLAVDWVQRVAASLDLDILKDGTWTLKTSDEEKCMPQQFGPTYADETGAFVVHTLGVDCALFALMVAAYICAGKRWRLESELKFGQRNMRRVRQQVAYLVRHARESG